MFRISVVTEVDASRPDSDSTAREVRRGFHRSSDRSLKGRLSGHSDMLSNAGSLAVTTFSTSGFGLVFWAIATHRLTQKQVGVDSALISAMTLAGTVGVLGMGSLLIAELGSRDRRSQARLISTVICAVLVFGFALGAVWLFSLLFSAQLSDGVDTPLLAIVFVVGVALTAAMLALDQATIGLLAGPLQMWRNAMAGVLKVAILVALVAIPATAVGHAPIISWVLGIALSVPFMTYLARRGGITLWVRPSPRELLVLRRASFDHSMLTLAMGVPRMAAPLIVALVVSADANAAFYIAWSVGTMLYVLPGHLSTVLFAVGKGRTAELRTKLVFTMTVSCGIGLPCALLLILFAHPVLHIFGASYASAGTDAMILLVAGLPGNILRLHYVAVARVQDRLASAWHLMVGFAIAEMVSLAVFGATGTITTAAAALCVVMTLEGVFTLPRVLKLVRSRPEPDEAVARAH